MCHDTMLTNQFVSVIEMKLRKRERVDYRHLHEEPKLSGLMSQRDQLRWPASKLWRFQIIEEREDEVKVHWDGWPASNDQWIARENVVDVPAGIEEADAFSHLTNQLFIQVRLRPKLSSEIFF